jgi:hypothetical protein
MGWKSVALGDESMVHQLTAFPSRHARVAYLLKVLNQLPELIDLYSVSTCQVMLNRLCDKCLLMQI